MGGGARDTHDEDTAETTSDSDQAVFEMFYSTTKTTQRNNL